jgi:hypothetical protein
MRTCLICEEEFDPNSALKRKIGGLISHCVDCSEESVIKYAGVQAADGKQNQATILKFDSENDKERYLRFWKNNSGYNRGKKVQLGAHLSTDPGIKFDTIVAHTATNHKGRA